MSCPHTIAAIYSSLTKAVRKMRRAKRFDRAAAARPLESQIRDYWDAGVDALFQYMADVDGWDKLHAHFALVADAEQRQVEKTLSPVDVRYLIELLAQFGYFADEAEKAEAIIRATAFPTWEAAAQHALGNLGVKDVKVELKNERIRELLVARKDAVVFANRAHMDQVLDTISRNFYDLGRNPYNEKFIDELRKDLGYKTNWEARRFSLTETGITSERAQVETYRQNGVGRKRWNILGVNTRPSHEMLDGVEAEIADTFDVGGYPADHPCDPSLPAAELVNCHCWLSPVVDDDYQIDPTTVWAGE